MITIKRILCPVDFSECATHALDHAVAIARWYRATISVLYVYRLPTLVAAYRTGGVAITTQVVEDLSVARHDSQPPAWLWRA